MSRLNPVVRLDDATYGNLMILQEQFGTGAAQTIAIVISNALGLTGLIKQAAIPDIDGDESGLTFTKVLSATVNGQPMAKPNWQQILIEVISHTGMTGKSLEDALNVGCASKRPDLFHDKSGYRYYPNLQVAIQGQSTELAWRETERLALAHGISVLVHFEWRANPKAAHPGKTGTLVSGKGLTFS